jgi:hemerythrin-like metal-binding protein
MALVEWSEKFSVKVPTFDAQHKQLFKLIDQLHQAMRTGQSKAQMSGILGELVKYTKTHFAIEEKELLAISYPEFGAHVAEHQMFTRKIDEFAANFACGVAGISVELMEFLNNWLVQHICRTDQKYSELMVQKSRI